MKYQDGGIAYALVKFPVTMTMDDWEQACKFWYGCKLWRCQRIIHKILFLKYVHVIMWICDVQTTRLMQTQSVAMQMISLELNITVLVILLLLPPPPTPPPKTLPPPPPPPPPLPHHHHRQQQYYPHTTNTPTDTTANNTSTTTTTTNTTTVAVFVNDVDDNEDNNNNNVALKID